MRSFLIIGLGKFGRHTALTLSSLGHDIMAIDIEPTRVTQITPYVTAAQIGDGADPNVLKALGVNNYDVCFVCTSGTLETSLEITSQLTDLKAKKIVAVTSREMHAKFFRQNGAAEVIYPEKDIAVRTAFKYSSESVFDFIELDSKCSIFEIATPKAWAGRSLEDVNIRKSFNLNIIAYRVSHSMVSITNTYVFDKSHLLVLAGDKENIAKFMTSGIIE